jgi:hypothetical protein
MKEKRVIQNYMDGWKMGDEGKILNTLSENCVITESHEPIRNVG